MLGDDCYSVGCFGAGKYTVFLGTLVEEEDAVVALSDDQLVSIVSTFGQYPLTNRCYSLLCFVSHIFSNLMYVESLCTICLWNGNYMGR